MRAALHRPWNCWPCGEWGCDPGLQRGVEHERGILSAEVQVHGEIIGALSILLSTRRFIIMFLDVDAAGIKCPVVCPHLCLKLVMIMLLLFCLFICFCVCVPSCL